MSSSPFPDPRTTNFIPEAWQWIDLWNKFRNFIVTYPKAQAFTINFQNPVYLTTRTALTQLASTAYATSEIVAWVTANVTPTLGTAKVWAILQYYFGGIAVNTINPLTTGGTLLIGGSTLNEVSIHSKEGRSTVLHLGDGNTSSGAIHINNGTNTTGNVNILDGTGSTGIITLGSSTSTINLNTSFTPLYTSFPITVGQVGSILPDVFLTTTPLPSAGQTSLRRVDFPTSGVWAVCGKITTGGTAPPYLSFGSSFGIGFSTLTGGGGTTFSKFGQQALDTNVPNTLTMFMSGYFATGTSLFLIGRETNSNPLYSEFIVYRVA